MPWVYGRSSRMICKERPINSGPAVDPQQIRSRFAKKTPVNSGPARCNGPAADAQWICKEKTINSGPAVDRS